jgi:hypothetical protein
MIGNSDTSWPRAIIPAASALSRTHEPQYMPPPRGDGQDPHLET